MIHNNFKLYTCLFNAAIWIISGFFPTLFERNYYSQEISIGIWRNRIALVYSAKSVNMVAEGKSEVTISEDGSTLVSKYRGADLSEDGKFAIDGQRLYNLSMHDDYGAHSIVIDIKGKGFQAYTFTFG